MAWNSIKDEVLNNTNGEIEVWGSNAPIRADSVIQTYFTVEQSPHYLSWLCANPLKTSEDKDCKD